MNQIRIVVLLLACSNLLGQTVTVDTLFFDQKEKFGNNQLDKLKFPMIKSSNPQVDALINTDLKNQFTDNEFPTESIDSTITKWAEESITNLEFEVTYNKNGILSINITAEGCGVYCTDWTSYYNYSTATGQMLMIGDVLDMKSFNSKILSDKTRQYSRQRKELKNMLSDKQSGIDTETYNWALEQFESCEQSFIPESFALHENDIEIIAHCELPHLIRNLNPTIELKYKYNDIRKYLRIRI